MDNYRINIYRKNQKCKYYLTCHCAKKVVISVSILGYNFIESLTIVSIMKSDEATPNDQEIGKNNDRSEVLGKPIRLNRFYLISLLPLLIVFLIGIFGLGFSFKQVLSFLLFIFIFMGLMKIWESAF